MITLCERASEIHGIGLFACHAMPEGTFIGAMWGEVAFASSSKSECEARGMRASAARGSIREIVLKRLGDWVVVVAEGPLALMNHANESVFSEECNVHVTPAGIGWLVRDVAAGEELRFDYRCY